MRLSYLYMHVPIMYYKGRNVFCKESIDIPPMNCSRAQCEASD